MTNKPILTKEQLEAKIDEFNNLPTEERHAGMKSSINCEHSRDFIKDCWDYAKKTSEERGITNLDDIFITFIRSVSKTIAQLMGVPEPVTNTFSTMLVTNDIFNGMLWHVFSEVAPEEDVVLLTGNFDIYSEVSNG